MKTKILTLLLLCLPVMLDAQNYEQQGDDLFAQAQYSKAEKKYVAAIEMQGTSTSLQTKKAKCVKCANLLAKAKRAEQAAQSIADYKNASKLYSDLYAIHALPQYKTKAKQLENKANLLAEEQRKEAERIAIEERERQQRVKAESYISKGTTSISNGKFMKRKDITNIIIPNSVTDIGEWAFADCTSLMTVTIGNNVTNIGDGAFIGCTSLTAVIIPNRVTNIGDYAFSRCSSLANVVIGDAVTQIGDNAFKGCSNLKTITIHSNTIANRPNLRNFFGSQVIECVIGNNVTCIGNTAFFGFSRLTSVTIGESVSIIGNSAFCNCSNLTSITNCAETPQKINRNVFEGGSPVDKTICNLYVPKQSIELYKNADVWKDFSNIQAISE